METPRDTIAGWTTSELVRFILNIFRQHPPSEIPTLNVDNLDIQKTLKCYDQLQFFNNQISVGAAGGASALPATPLGYFRVLDYRGKTVLIPYYNS